VERRAFLTGLSGCDIITMSPVSEIAGPEPAQPTARAFIQGLRILGDVEGQNLILERRSARPSGSTTCGTRARPGW